MTKSPGEMAQSMIDNIPAKAGRSLDDRLQIVATAGLEKHRQIVKYLKERHSMTIEWLRNAYERA